MKIKRLIYGIFLFAALMSAQQTYTNNDVLAFWKQGLTETFLVNLVQQSPGAYSLAPEDMRALIAAKVPNSVIEAMGTKLGAAPVPNNIGTPAPVPPPVPNMSGASAGWPAPMNEVTISYRPDNAAVWTPLATEPVMWTREGVTKIVKKVATAGIAGRPYTGILSGPTSVSVLSNPPEFVIDMVNANNPNAWKLVPLRKNKKDRTVTDPAHQALMIHMVERRGNQYRMRSDNDLAPGEYALVSINPSGDESPAGMLYTFRIR